MHSLYAWFVLLSDADEVFRLQSTLTIFITFITEIKTIYTPGYTRRLIMAALWDRAGHYIFAVWFLSSFFFLFSSPNLSGRRLDVYRTSIHGVALVRI